ncbi:hypothetical protein B0H14DRAFT_2973453 [Mycena olivaceomarginata]|nr:hypothetical protein B0H14DRAFT_2973453 [Mycena olivaceomarginata]
MAPYTKSEEDRGFEGVHDDQSEKAYSILERELPPLPDEDVPQTNASNRPFLTSTLKPSPSALLFPPSLATPSKHDLVFPIASWRPRSSSLRPKLHLDTGWDAPPRPMYLQEIHSAGDVTSRTFISTPPSSRKDSISTTSASSLLPHYSDSGPALAHHPSTSSFPRVTVTEASSSAPRNTNAKSLSSCRFLSAVFPKLAAPKLSTLVQTKRAVDENSIHSIRAKPFIHSDPRNPLHGITVTVSRQRLVSEPMIMPLPDLMSQEPMPGIFYPSRSATSLLSIPSASASSMSLVDLNLDKPLPTPTPIVDREDLHLPPSDDVDGDDLPRTIPVPALSDDIDQWPRVSPDTDEDPFIDPTEVDLPPTPPDPDDSDLEPEVVEFKSHLSVMVTPATATRLHVPGRPPKRRKRYTGSPPAPHIV